jgi:hypothetical protein
MIEGTPRGSLAVCQDKGWLTREPFVTYLEHFCRIVKASEDSPVVVTVDSHS